jgi:hypothetical protein
VSRAKRRLVTITRTIEIGVIVDHHPGVPQTWWEQGEPAETWIHAAYDDEGEPVELTDIEARLAVREALKQLDEDPNPIDPEPELAGDDQRPF